MVVEKVANEPTKHTQTVSLIAGRFTCSVTSFGVPSETLFMHQPNYQIHIFETKVAVELI